MPLGSSSTPYPTGRTIGHSPDRSAGATVLSADEASSFGSRHAAATRNRLSVSFGTEEYVLLCELARTSQRSLAWVVRHAVGSLLRGKLNQQLDLPFNSSRFGTVQPIVADPPDVSTGLALAAQQASDQHHRVHAIHSYPGRFAPEVSASLIEAFTAQGETVLDPFCGSGTTLVEALRLGRNAIGVDVNPLAALITRVKCRRLSDRDRAAIRASVAWARTLVEGFYRQVRLPGAQPAQLLFAFRERYPAFGLELPQLIPDADTIGRLSQWFPSPAIYELALIVDVVRGSAAQAAKEFCLVALSAIVTSVSVRKSETRYLKVQRAVKPFDTLKRWALRVESMLDCLGHVESPGQSPTAQVYQADARCLMFIGESCADFVLASPPYPNAFDYGAQHRLRLLLLGLQDTWSPQQEIGSHRRYSRARTNGEANYEQEVREVLLATRHVLRPGKMCALIVRGSRIGGAMSDNVGCVARAATSAGYVVVNHGAPITSAIGALKMRSTPKSDREQLVLLRREQPARS